MMLWLHAKVFSFQCDISPCKELLPQFQFVCLYWTCTEFRKIKNTFESCDLKLRCVNVPKCHLNLVVLNMPCKMLGVKSYKM